MTATRRSLLVALALAAPALAQEPKQPPLPPPPEPPALNPLPPGARPDPEAVPAPLSLDEVLASVEGYFPLLAAAEQERAIADGQALAARGVFDLNLRARDSFIQGSYDSHRFDVGFEQATPFHGVSGFAGYRIGAGQFPVYYGDRKTAEGGEVRAGLFLPLLRDRAIDRRRAAIQQADITRLLADPVVQRQRIDFYRGAGVAYWAWVAAGRRYDLGRRLLAKAAERNENLAKMARGNAIRNLEVLDNYRAVVDRQARLVALERRYQGAALDLSLYLRDAAGEPVVPTPGRLPDFPEPVRPDLDGTDADVALARNLRPEPRRFALLRERAGVDLRLAENQMLPGVNAVFAGQQDVGPGKKDLDRYTYEAAVVVDVPLQRREARGRAQAARATIAQVGGQERFALDRIATDVRDAASALDRAYELLRRARDSVRLAREVEEGEIKTFQAGGPSTLLTINLRELITFDAQVTEVDALFEYYRALADYRAALGLDARPQGADGAPCRPEP